MRKGQLGQVNSGALLRTSLGRWQQRLGTASEGPSEDFSPRGMGEDVGRHLGGVLPIISPPSPGNGDGWSKSSLARSSRDVTTASIYAAPWSIRSKGSHGHQDALTDFDGWDFPALAASYP